MTRVRLGVTGASGFCGSAVASLAAQRGLSVVCVGRRPGPVGAHRFWDATSGPPDLSGIDAVVHLAAAVGNPAPTSANERAFHRVNVEGADRLLQAAGSRPVVFVSSGSVYAPGPRLGIVESAPLCGQLNAYGRSKASGDRLAEQAGAVVLRPRAVYGTGDRQLLPRLTRLVCGRTLLLPGPDTVLSLTAVENLAAACLDALTWPPGAYNLSDAEPYRRDDALRRVLSATTGRDLVVRHLPVAPLRAAAALLERTARHGEPLLSRYALDLLTCDSTYDLTRALAQGYRPTWVLADHVLRLRQPVSYAGRRGTSE